MVFERMSEGCVAAIVSAQEQHAKVAYTATDELGTGGGDHGRQVQDAHMLVGLVDHPETLAMKRTLEQYGITYRKVTKAIQVLYSTSSSSWISSLSSLKKIKMDRDRDPPFSRQLKATFTRAGELATEMGSSGVGTHHVFLALLQYQEYDDDDFIDDLPDSTSGGDADADPEPYATATTSSNEKHSAWWLLTQTDGWDKSTSALDICHSLLERLKDDPGVETGSGREMVAAGETVRSNTASSTSSSGLKKATPVLEECGTDLTQLASDGLLDPVYGRDGEIKSCLRTLLRRRKNCVCLLGDPGVGKVTSFLCFVVVSVRFRPCPLT